MTKRTSLADLLKGIAVIFMIQVHIIELFANPQIFTSNNGSFLLFLGGPLVAPVFGIIFGYFIAKSTLSKKQTLLRGAKLFAVGLLLNLMLNFNLFLKIFQGEINTNPLPYLFGVDFLLFAGLSILFLGILKKTLNKSILISVFLSLFFAFLSSFLLKISIENEILKYFSAFFFGSTHWSYFPLFPWISYPLIGFAFYQIQQKIKFDSIFKLKPFSLLGSIGIVFIYFTGNYAIAAASNLQEYYHHGIIFFIWTVVFLAFYGFVLTKINVSIGDGQAFTYIKWLGKNVTSIYFIQWVLIGNIGTEVYKTISNPMVLLGSFLGILILSSLLCVVYLKITNRKKTIKA